MTMQYRPLGSTGLEVSVISLGTGGASRLGQAVGRTTAESTAVVHHALDRGINLFDTAPVYAESESLLGAALAATRRDTFLLSTKVTTLRDGNMATPEDVEASILRSLELLQTDHLDIVHFHGVLPHHLDEVSERLLPVLQRHKSAGNIRSIGLTENQRVDTRHESALRAIADPRFDVVMVARNFMRPTVTRQLVAAANEQGVGVIGMTAVRHTLHDPERFAMRVQHAVDAGWIDGDTVDAVNPLGWLLDVPGVTTLSSAAYKYAISQPGVATILTGTSSIDHLDDNIDAAIGSPLPVEVVDRLEAIFADVDESLFESPEDARAPDGIRKRS